MKHNRRWRVVNLAVPGDFIISSSTKILTLTKIRGMGFIIRLFFTWLAVIIASYILPGIHINDYISALIFAAVLALLNLFLKPVLVILTIPITLVTLGLFLLVINACIILVGDYFVDGLKVDNFWWALLFSLVISVIVSVFESFDKKMNKK